MAILGHSVALALPWFIISLVPLCISIGTLIVPAPGIPESLPCQEAPANSPNEMGLEEAQTNQPDGQFVPSASHGDADQVSDVLGASAEEELNTEANLPFNPLDAACLEGQLQVITQKLFLRRCFACGRHLEVEASILVSF